jgi:hypothetical protein
VEVGTLTASRHGLRELAELRQYKALSYHRVNLPLGRALPRNSRETHEVLKVTLKHAPLCRAVRGEAEPP